MRGSYDATPVSTTDLKTLAAATVPAVDLVMITEPRRIDDIRDIKAVYTLISS